MKFLSHHFPPSLRRTGRRSESGVALIITLILLSIITFMAITFLVLSQRERGSVSTTTDQMKAKGAAETAIERVKIELLAPMLTYRNPQLYDFFVSTNFINSHGFDPSTYQNQNQYTNVNFDFLSTTLNPLTPAQWLQNLTNLFYDPRPPVFIVTNELTGRTESRYYLDLNRNKRFDGSGLQLVVGTDPASPFFGTNASGVVVPQSSIIPGNTLSNIVTGDPQWIGVLEYPDRPHSSSNRFVARYAFVAVPADGTLDLNAIHNNGKQKFIYNPGSDGFYRNQGVGPWEINLASGLADLNSNYWNNAVLGGVYNYDLTFANVNRGAAFDDASQILAYRYSRKPMWRVFDLFPQNQNTPGLAFDNIDMYSDGPLVFGTGLGDERAAAGAFGIPDNINNPWPGSDNPQHYFTLQELLDPNKTSADFTNRFRLAGQQTNSYDAYTYYRFIQNFGTESQPEPVKINVNYRNVDDNGIVVPGLETNLLPWTPDLFFSSAGNRLLRQSTEVWAQENPYDYTNTFGVNTPFGITNIPVYVSYSTLSNFVLVTNVMCGYTPAVHRLLQVVANVYDSTTNRSFGAPQPSAGFPTVFRPIFRRGTNDPFDVFIVGYREVVDARMADQATAPLMLDLLSSTDRQKIPIFGVPVITNDLRLEPMVSGIPLVIGAKKGFPSFNKFAMENTIRVTRKLRFHRNGNGPLITNQSYSVTISNALGIQAWNSYRAAYPRNLKMVVAAQVGLSMSNEVGIITGPPPTCGTLTNFNLLGTNILIPANTWLGFSKTPQSPVSFKVPGTNNMFFIPKDAPYRQDSDIGGSFCHNAEDFWDSDNRFRVPKLWLNTRVQVRYILVDTSVNPNRIVDYVNLDSSEPPLNIVAAALGEQGLGCDDNFDVGSPIADAFWCTNRVGYRAGLEPPLVNTGVPTFGVQNQINFSQNRPSAAGEEFWANYDSGSGSSASKDDQVADFYRRLNVGPESVANLPPSDRDFQAPFNPTRKINQYVRWEANDPLVHYTVADLRDLMTQKPVNLAWPIPNLDQPDADDPLTSQNLRALSKHSRPWGGNYYNTAPTRYNTQFDTSVKDPLVVFSDDWDFPTNKLPNVGWLGRIHRGSPWQTVYLKSSDLGLTNYYIHMTNAITWARLYDNATWSNAPSMWLAWSGNTNKNDAFYSRPVQDRLLFDVFTADVNENSMRGRLSINQSSGRTNDLSAGLPAWSAVLGGVIVTTNNAGEWTVIEPASTSPEVLSIVRGINRTRWATNLVTGTEVFPQKRFMHLGDVLATPELSIASPFLKPSGVASSVTGTRSDAIVERLPEQIMGLITLNDSPRFVIYAYGQTLHPAVNSVIRSAGPYFGLCTNYQVTAESAIRCVVRIDGITPTNQVPRMIVEQYNVLPPD